ncbi:hypothetical protein KAFR_0D02910 [Kazachstania africana CBS 2517]|uniref:DASH complex subunit HSK3 n=1 Tax=Kazachstania africana (strain ATCC 22294 / BCRC 22015 / CBS 2517 / CECT 1963 / NBRC 1671 / NRRL Y-8276) TaxID=1071382 RepID=H2AU89_KAZAF|nr:hypothetical protein KAFR_0D02910 [Kazachstania africana CBS 2517]CCF57939.1 hypothetical protein KAFR_0D02910 [Kazachstania africana CBS 2517]
MNNSKKRQYAYLAQQLQQLQTNLQTTKDEMSVLSSQCNKNIVGQLGKINASWFVASNRWLENEIYKEK